MRRLSGVGVQVPVAYKVFRKGQVVDAPFQVDVLAGSGDLLHAPLAQGHIVHAIHFGGAIGGVCFTQRIEIGDRTIPVTGIEKLESSIVNLLGTAQVRGRRNKRGGRKYRRRRNLHEQEQVGICGLQCRDSSSQW